jgi:hypothetical protein
LLIVKESAPGLVDSLKVLFVSTWLISVLSLIVSLCPCLVSVSRICPLMRLGC